MREIGLPLSQVPVGDAYAQATTVNCPGAKRITVFVFNNSVYYQLALDRDGNQWYQLESDLPPGFHSLARVCSGIRFRNFIAGQVATISVKALQ